jgi:hypothetical protein
VRKQTEAQTAPASTEVLRRTTAAALVVPMGSVTLDRVPVTFAP